MIVETMATISTASPSSSLSAAHCLSPFKFIEIRKKKKTRKCIVVLSSSSSSWAQSAADKDKEKEREAREKREEANRKIASMKAISIILRREATKAVIEKKRGGTNSKKLLPRTVLEALHERITALRWESALKVSFWSFILTWAFLQTCSRQKPT